MKERLRTSDIAIFCGIAALILFGHSVIADRSANAAGLTPLLMQGSGISYLPVVNENASQLEFNAREMLYTIGSAQLSYATNVANGRYAELQELKNIGYLQPNVTGGLLVGSYSITFYLPQNKHGFTLVAEPDTLDLRPFMITENQDVVLLTPSIMTDPTEAWETVRAMESEMLYDTNRYGFFNGLQLLNYDPPLQVRLNAEQTSYALHSFSEGGTYGFTLDESIVYIDSFASYLAGDTRDFEDVSY